jgi:hypothetical protein
MRIPASGWDCPKPFTQRVGDNYFAHCSIAASAFLNLCDALVTMNVVRNAWKEKRTTNENVRNEEMPHIIHRRLNSLLK